MIRKIRELFPPDVNPFAAGLGNRDNDAIAYLAAGIPKNKIYLVGQKSELSNLEGVHFTNFTQLYE